MNFTAVIVIGFFGLLFLFLATTIVDDGEVGVKKTLGNYNDEELTTGVNFKMPIISRIYTVDVKKTTLEEHVTAPSSEGLIVELNTSVIFKIKKDRASEIKQTVSGDILETLIKPYVRNGIRDIATGHEAKAMYTEEGRQEISAKLKLYLEDKLSENIYIEDVLLRDVKMPDKVRNAIENKLDVELKSQAKQFELDAAIKDAEIEVARARGIAEANEIVAGSITDNYIKYKFVEGLNSGNTEVIYVPTEANLPILEATRRSPIEQ